MAEQPEEPVGQLDARAVPRFGALRTFARLPREHDVQRVDVAVLGAPFDGGATFRTGARFGPAAIREASILLRPYNEPLRSSPFATAQVVDSGDAEPSPLDIASAHRAIEARAGELHARGASVLGLGGDHSVALPLLRAAAAAHGPLALVQLDAHTDTWDSYFGERVSHGTIFRRAIEEGLIDPARSVQIGLRGSLYATEDLAENAELGFRTLLARALDSAGGAARPLELIAEAVGGPAYVTVDIDVLDPAFAPGTGTPEAGGLTTRELLAIVRGLQAVSVDVRAADVVEVCPPYDHAQVTAIAAANVAYDLVTLLAARTAR
jgi:agmatinase